MQQGLLFAGPVAMREAPRPIADEPFSRPADRARAYTAWLEDGQPWPPPAGLLSACISACLPRHQPRRFR